MEKLDMFPHETKGMLITFCGLDGCGKSTVIKMLSESLTERGIDCVVTKQPTDNVRNSGIFRTFMDCPENGAYEYRALSLLAASDRVQHSNKFIMEKLREGKVVISDRYFYSCYANLLARGFYEDSWILEIARYIPAPDYAFFLNLPVMKAVNRVRAREEEKNRYIDMLLQYKLKENYLAISAENEGYTVNSDRPAEDTFAEITRILKSGKVIL